MNSSDNNSFPSHHRQSPRTPKPNKRYLTHTTSPSPRPYKKQRRNTPVARDSFVDSANTKSTSADFNNSHKAGNALYFLSYLLEEQLQNTLSPSSPSSSSHSFPSSSASSVTDIPPRHVLRSPYSIRGRRVILTDASHSCPIIPSSSPSLPHPISQEIYKSSSLSNLSLSAASASDKSVSFSQTSKKFEQSCRNLHQELKNTLKSSAFRRFCGYEWFYSGVDCLYFAHNEFENCLYALGMSKSAVATPLTRFEWDYIRTMLGRVRRFSPYFLQEERNKLQQFRDSARSVQRGQDLDAPPQGVSFVLSVGQRVIARHKQSHSYHSGVVESIVKKETPASLIFEYDIKFDETELGIITLSDIDVMPLTFPGLMCSPISYDGTFSMTDSSNVFSDVTQSHEQQPQQCITVTHSFPRTEDDLVLLSRFLQLLDRKQALLTHLARMNSIAEKLVQEASGSTPSFSHTFRQRYAWVICQLEQTNQVLNSVHCTFRIRLSSTVDNENRTRAPTPTLSPDTPLSVRLLRRCQADAVELIKRLRSQILPKSKASPFSTRTRADIIESPSAGTKQREWGRKRPREVNVVEDENDNLYYTRSQALEIASDLKTVNRKKRKITNEQSDDSDQEFNLSSVDSAIASCVALSLLIKACSEKGLVPVGFETLLNDISPVCEANLKLYENICDSILLVKSSLAAN